MIPGSLLKYGMDMVQKPEVTDMSGLPLVLMPKVARSLPN